MACADDIHRRGVNAEQARNELRRKVRVCRTQNERNAVHFHVLQLRFLLSVCVIGQDEHGVKLAAHCNVQDLSAARRVLTLHILLRRFHTVRSQKRTGADEHLFAVHRAHNAVSGLKCGLFDLRKLALMLAEHLLEHAAKRAAELLHQRAGSQNGFFKALLLKRLHPVQNDRAAREKLCGINQNGIYGAHALDTFIAGDHRAAAAQAVGKTAHRQVYGQHIHHRYTHAAGSRQSRNGKGRIFRDDKRHHAQKQRGDEAHRRQNLRRGLCRVRLIGNL